MNRHYSLARRIVTTFVLMTAVVSGLFSLGIVSVIHSVETRLVSEELQGELDAIMANHADMPPDVSLHGDNRFYASDRPERPIPERYQALPSGFTELTEEEQSFVFVQEQAGQRYVLVRPQDDFEAHEETLHRVIITGFVLCILGAWLLGHLMAQRVIMPVTRLAQQVRHRDQLHPSAPPLAPSYPNDEVGRLATAFDETLGKLHAYLERERLFTSDVSHELRTPLMVISSSCELLAEAGLSAEQQTRIARIQRAADEIGALVQTFLMLARAERGSTLETRRSSLADIARQHTELWTPLMHEQGLEFSCYTEAPDPGLYSPTLLGTVMSNLLRNALHYTEQGEVRLILFEGGFRVEDSGPGIPTEQQSTLFSPFVRGPEARGEGCGLGLSLVRRICRHEGWTISLEARAPSGCCFAVALTPRD